MGTVPLDFRRCEVTVCAASVVFGVSCVPGLRDLVLDRFDNCCAVMFVSVAVGYVFGGLAGLPSCGFCPWC